MLGPGLQPCSAGALCRLLTPNPILPAQCAPADSSDDDSGAAAAAGARRGAAPSSSGSSRGTGRPRGRPPKSAAGPPPLQELPADFIAQRQAANPRDSPEQGGNVEYP